MAQTLLQAEVALIYKYGRVHPVGNSTQNSRPTRPLQVSFIPAGKGIESVVKCTYSGQVF